MVVFKEPFNEEMFNGEPLAKIKEQISEEIMTESKSRN